MTSPRSAQAARAPLPPGDADFAEAILEGLARPQKELPCRFLYDRRGSELFEEITGLEAYYPTRTEMAILTAHAGEMVAGIGARPVLIEFGSGSSRKTEAVIAAIADLAAYVPVDVSPSALAGAQARLAARFAGLGVRPLVGDFTRPLTIARDIADRPRLGFFPGSTIGNFAPDDAVELLSNLRASLGPSSRLIVGADLVKDEALLLRAYDDPQGVTAAFNLNLLERINRTFGPTFDVAAFRHLVRYDRSKARIEMHLQAQEDLVVRFFGATFDFAEGETIHTENSHKFTLESLRALAVAAGWRPGRIWCDAAALFSVHELTAPPA